MIDCGFDLSANVVQYRLEADNLSNTDPNLTWTLSVRDSACVLLPIKEFDSFEDAITLYRALTNDTQRIDRVWSQVLIPDRPTPAPTKTQTWQKQLLELNDLESGVAWAFTSIEVSDDEIEWKCFSRGPDSHDLVEFTASSLEMAIDAAHAARVDHWSYEPMEPCQRILVEMKQLTSEEWSVMPVTEDGETYWVCVNEGDNLYDLQMFTGETELEAVTVAHTAIVNPMKSNVVSLCARRNL